jgi:hypothetical protein
MNTVPSPSDLQRYEELAPLLTGKEFKTFSPDLNLIGNIGLSNDTALKILSNGAEVVERCKKRQKNLNKGIIIDLIGVSICAVGFVALSSLKNLDEKPMFVKKMLPMLCLVGAINIALDVRKKRKVKRYFGEIQKHSDAALSELSRTVEISSSLPSPDKYHTNYFMHLGKINDTIILFDAEHRSINGK